MFFSVTLRIYDLSLSFYLKFYHVFKVVLLGTINNLKSIVLIFYVFVNCREHKIQEKNKLLSNEDFWTKWNSLNTINNLQVFYDTLLFVHDIDIYTIFYFNIKSRWFIAELMFCLYHLLLFAVIIKESFVMASHERWKKGNIQW